jgi:hypothetical protein
MCGTTVCEGGLAGDADRYLTWRASLEMDGNTGVSSSTYYIALRWFLTCLQLSQQTGPHRQPCGDGNQLWPRLFGLEGARILYSKSKSGRVRRILNRKALNGHLSVPSRCMNTATSSVLCHKLLHASGAP